MDTGWRPWVDSRVRAGALAVAGASVAVGYGPLAAAGVVATRATVSIYGAPATIGPAPVPAVVLAGVVVPAAFGALGGAAATGLLGLLRRRLHPLLVELRGRPPDG